MNKDKFEKDMAVFSFKQHQDFLTYTGMLNEFGYSIDDVQNYIETKKSEMDLSSGPERHNFIKCPDCGFRMMLLPVNDSPSTRTGDDSRSVLICHNKECMYTEYSKKTVGEIIQNSDFSKP